jgi:hypothetical protein
MFAWELEVGGLYTTKHLRRATIELYSRPHTAGDEGNLESTLGSLLYEDDYFVVLEVQLIHKTYYCLKLLTSEGLIGWTCFGKDYNDCFEEVKSE